MVPTDIFGLTAEGSIIAIKFQEADTSSWVVPPETIAQICDGTPVQINGSPIANLIIKMDGDKVVVGSKSATYSCPLSIDEAALRNALMLKMIDYEWTDADMKAALAAFDARHFTEVSVEVTIQDQVIVDLATNFPLWGSPYGKRWTENNLFDHIRDEAKDGKVALVRLDLADRRIFILSDDCGGIAKVSVGTKPAPVVQTKPKKAAPAKPVRQQQSGRPSPRDIPMICAKGCK